MGGLLDIKRKACYCELRGYSTVIFQLCWGRSATSVETGYWKLTKDRLWWWGRINHRLPAQICNNINRRSSMFPSYVPLSFVGVKYLHECPKEPYLPIYLLVGGCFWLLKMFTVLWRQMRERKSSDSSADTLGKSGRVM